MYTITHIKLVKAIVLQHTYTLAISLKVETFYTRTHMMMSSVHTLAKCLPSVNIRILCRKMNLQARRFYFKIFYTLYTKRGTRAPVTFLV